MEKPGRLQSMGSLRVGYDWRTSLSCIGEGDDNPLQCSCLENPRDTGAWWAAIYGVTQSQTWLKWLSSSSSSAITPAAETVRVPAHLVPQGPHKPSSWTTFTFNSHWGRAATGKKCLVSMCAGSFRSCLTLQPCRLWPARLLCQGGVFTRQEYWSVLAQYLLPYPSAAAKSLQSCPTLCDPIDGSPPGSPVPGILQARIVKWVAISFSNAWKWKVKVKSLSRVRPLTIPWTAAYQAPLPMGFSRQEYWSGVPLPTLLEDCISCCLSCQLP